MNRNSIFKIEFEGNKYPARKVYFKDKEDFYDGYYTVATLSLEDKLLTSDGGKYTSKEAQRIDEQILFFVGDDEIYKPDSYIQKILRDNIDN